MAENILAETGNTAKEKLKALLAAYLKFATEGSRSVMGPLGLSPEADWGGKEQPATLPQTTPKTSPKAVSAPPIKANVSRGASRLITPPSEDEVLQAILPDQQKDLGEQFFSTNTGKQAEAEAFAPKYESPVATPQAPPTSEVKNPWATYQSRDPYAGDKWGKLFDIWFDLKSYRAKTAQAHQEDVNADTFARTWEAEHQKIEDERALKSNNENIKQLEEHNANVDLNTYRAGSLKNDQERNTITLLGHLLDAQGRRGAMGGQRGDMEGLKLLLTQLKPSDIDVALGKEPDPAYTATIDRLKEALGIQTAAPQNSSDGESAKREAIRRITKRNGGQPINPKELQKEIYTLAEEVKDPARKASILAYAKDILQGAIQR